MKTHKYIVFYLVVGLVYAIFEETKRRHLFESNFVGAAIPFSATSAGKDVAAWPLRVLGVL